MAVASVALGFAVQPAMTVAELAYHETAGMRLKVDTFRGKRPHETRGRKHEVGHTSPLTPHQIWVSG